MMREVMWRRLSKILDESIEVPDLMIIDGGRGQLNAIVGVMQELKLSIPSVAMSKGVMRHAGMEKFHTTEGKVISPDKNSAVMKYLQILRDEAHNFAIKTHRNKRSRAINLSKLEEIENIGQKRKQSLLNYFGSYKAVKEASIEELSQVKGIGKIIANKILGE
jgi:excinuclease ABC subunit C